MKQIVYAFSRKKTQKNVSFENLLYLWTNKEYWNAETNRLLAYETLSGKYNTNVYITVIADD